MTARYIAYAVTKTNKYQTKTQTDAQAANGRTGKNGAAACKKYKEHRSDTFGNKLFHK